MKQLLLFFAAMLFSCCFSGNEVNAETPANSGKTLVVYYSYTGNSRAIVNTLTSQIEADVLEIQPVEKGLKYEANNYALGTQLLNAIKANPNDANSYPAIDPVTTSLSNYQNIIIVTPLWWGQMAGKHVAMIVSSASSDINDVVEDAKRLLPDVTWMGDALWINNSNRSNTSSLVQNWLKTLTFAEENTTMDKMYITIGGQTQSVTLVNNTATQELVAALQNAPITVTLNDNNFEIWGSLGQSLTTKNEQMTAQPGDVVLYNGSNICIFYDSNSWSYTRLGHIDGLSESELRTFLKAGQNNISVTLSLTSGTTAIKSVNGNRLENGAYYSLNGVKMENPSKGIYIKNGKKVIL